MDELDEAFVADDLEASFEQGDPQLEAAVAGGNYAETGRVLELPETTIEGRPEGGGSVSVAEGPATEYREVSKRWQTDRNAQAPRSLGERVQQYVSGDDPEALGSGYEGALPLRAMAGGQVPSLGGRDLPSLPSLRRALSVGGDLDVLMPATNTTAPIVGTDRRPLAAATGATDAATFGLIDELAGAVGGDSRMEQERARTAGAQEQAGAEYALGYAGGTAPLALIPGAAATAPGRMAVAGGTGLGAGMLRGIGEAEGSLSERLPEGVRQGAIEGLAAAGTAGLAEAAAPVMSRVAGGIADRIPVMRDVRNQAALEARGIYGNRAMQTAQGLPGGVEGVARNLDELGIPLDPRRAARRLTELEAETGPEVGRVARAIQDRGGAVNMGRLADQIEQLAASREAGAGMRGPAEYLRREVRDQWRAQAAANPEGVPFMQEIIDPDGGRVMGGAWGEDQNLRRLGADTSAQGLRRVSDRLGAARRTLSNELGSVADSVGLGDDWRNARRAHAILMDLDEIAGGDFRRNVQGGIGGAFNRAQGISAAMRGDALGAAEAVVGPFVQQEARFRLPGLQVRTLDRLIPALEAGSPALQRASRALQAAQQRGDAAVGAAHYMLARTSPEYRRAHDEAARMAAEETDR